MSYTSYSPETDLPVTRTGQSGAGRTGADPGGAGLAVAGSTGEALGLVLAGMQGGVDVRGFQAGIEAGQRALGNRAFLNWVQALQSGEREAPLQLMGKKKKKPVAAEVEAGTGEQAAGAKGDVVTGTEGTAAPGPEAAQPQATGTTPGVEPEPREGVAGGVKKKKKKSRVQVALNTLREEGVAAFRGYIEAEIGETGLLRTLEERITRAEDLAGVMKEALGVVEGRMRLLDPLLPASPGTSCAGQASAELNRRREPEKAVIAPVKSVLSLRDMMLFDACNEGNIRSLKRFLRYEGVDVNVSDEQATLLVYAVYGGYADIVKVLLEQPNVDVNLAQTGGATPLYLATTLGHVEIVRLLLGARGINVNLATSEGATPLMIAAQKGREEVMKLLLAVPGIELDAQKGDRATALYMAVQIGFPGIVKQLVRAGADVNLPLSNGMTPLSNAAGAGHIEIVKILLQVPGVRVNQPTDVGLAPLSLAALRGHKEIVRLLIRKRADLNLPDRDGATPLTIASLSGHTAIVEMLLYHGADASAGMNLQGLMTFTPGGIAELAGHREMMSVLAAHRRRREKAQKGVEDHQQRPDPH